MAKVQLSVILLTSFIITSCGQNAAKLKSDSGSSNKSLENLVTNCSVTKDAVSGDVTIECPDGSTATLRDGTDGANGVDGVDGQDGTSCSVAQQVGGAMITCGTQQVFIRDGVDGTDGSACSVTQDVNGSGALITCSDGSQAFISNGTDGQDGVDGQDGQNGLNTVVEVIDPCGAQMTQGFDEVLLKLADNTIIAMIEIQLNGNGNGNGNKVTYLTKIKPGNYITSDGTGCHFSVTANGTVSW